ncbi:cAMP-activated global transcriptional regulator CRP [Enterobacteriaceae endosymbiont of Neohaemonia nigricornis]|uniref:cAMP-activated global transcriptional regulator CRP n=1 Tax=Enterobacteriaceae endosymbiont of Neohaemonia nigricornis TaxID=2675792 RepID=UPI0014494163|nr:cAMP-activated global transcriptional regulator CRP [Enterobacteriaceae endosymbiont of Neohaemonia nigricornis]QJC30528.1 cAMP-activated global transcriptional regulator CRP [Enterobacteriaceae endosymbiont of Neohaemonia nigricornis]
MIVFKSQKDPTLTWFLSYCSIQKYSAKKILINQGDIVQNVYYILKGSVTVLMHNKNNNKEIILYYLNSGNFIGTLGIFDNINKLSTTLVKSKTECEVAVISYQKFLNLIKINNNIIMTIASQIANRLYFISKKIRDLIFLNVQQRINITLLHLAQLPEAITHPDGMQIKITRQEIGKIVGCSRETVGRILKILENNNIISAKGKTIIVYGTR